MKEFIKDYPNFWDKRIYDENGNRICKYPFTHWMTTGITVGIVTAIITQLSI